MAPRLQLQTLLESFVGNVYFQPPTNVRMHYPCIVYKRDNAESEWANNANYRYMKRYMVTVIDRDPDSVLPEQVAGLSLCSFVRFYTADGLNHDVYNLFF